MNFSYSIEGGVELDQALTELEAKTATKYIRSAGRDAMKLVQQQAKATAPSRSGFLRTQIKIISRAKKGIISIAVSISKRAFVSRAFYGWFQEAGYHIGRRVRRKSKH